MTPRARSAGGADVPDVPDVPVLGPAEVEGFARAVVETIREPLLVLDDELQVESANPAFYRHFDVAPDDILRRSIFALGDGQWDVPALRDLLERVIPRHIEVRDVVVEHELPGLGHRTMLVSARQLRGEGRAYRLILVAFQDVTEQRKAERALTRYSRELKRSNRELEEFAHAASHDLQEPLRKIGTFSSRLAAAEAEGLEGPSLLYLERIQDAVVRMQTRIDDLLELARVGRELPRSERVDLAAVVSSAFEQVDHGMPDDAEVTVGALPHVEADPLGMELLFQNLLGNAVKYRRDDTPLRLDVEGGATDSPLPDDARPWIRIVVRDNGIGFDPQYSERIFGAFQRLHGRSDYEGSGVGLSICRKVVENHGGQITAHGEEGAGARFEIVLPVTQPDDFEV